MVQLTFLSRIVRSENHFHLRLLLHHIQDNLSKHDVYLYTMNTLPNYECYLYPVNTLHTRLQTRIRTLHKLQQLCDNDSHALILS